MATPRQNVEDELRAVRIHWRVAIAGEYRTAEAAAMQRINELLDLLLTLARGDT